MWTSLAIVAAITFAPGQAGFTLGNARITYGELGAVRPDSKFLPGDIFFVSFDIDGIKVSDDGKVKYSMGMVVVNKDNAPIFKSDPQAREDFLPLGGTKLPARAYVNIGLDQAPGIYSCKVTVVDSASKTSQTLDTKFEVLKPAFGLVQVFTSGDDKGEIPVPAVGVSGQSIFVHFAVVGFGRDAKSKQPDVEVEMSITLKDGTPALKIPTKEKVVDRVGEQDSGIPMRFLLPMNRAGDFNIELKATDKVSKATSKVTLPIKVLPAN